MGNYLCRKCGMDASSKCAIQRNVFPSDELATLVGNRIKIEAVRMGSVDERFRRESDSDQWQVVYTITNRFVTARSDAEAIEKADEGKRLSELEEMHPGILKRAFCDHEWRIKDGQTCMFGCCVGESLQSVTQ